MVLSCAEPLALPSRSFVRSSLSESPRLSSALQPEEQGYAKTLLSDARNSKMAQLHRGLLW